MAMNGVPFLMGSRIHVTEEQIDEASFSQIFEWDFIRRGTFGDSRSGGYG